MDSRARPRGVRRAGASCAIPLSLPLALRVAMCALPGPSVARVSASHVAWRAARGGASARASAERARPCCARRRRLLVASRARATPPWPPLLVVAKRARTSCGLRQGPRSFGVAARAPFFRSPTRRHARRSAPQPPRLSRPTVGGPAARARPCTSYGPTRGFRVAASTTTRPCAPRLPPQALRTGKRAATGRAPTLRAKGSRKSRARTSSSACTARGCRTACGCARAPSLSRHIRRGRHPRALPPCFLSLFFLARSLARSLTLTYCWRAYARARPLYLVLPQYTPPPPADSGWRVLEQTLLQGVVR